VAEVKIDIIAVDSFSGVLGNFGNIMTGLKSTVDLLKSAFDTLVAPVLEFGYESAMAASRVSELKIVNEALADITGNGAVSMGLLAEKIRDQGIEAASAQEAVSKLMIYELDLTHAVDLATIAQNAAVVAGTNSTDMMDRLIYGITTLNTRVLRTGGIMINLNDAYEEYGALIGKSADALNVQERQQAALNAVLEFGTNIVGLYDLAMENAFKRFGSYPRYINDIQVALGEQLEPALRNIVFAGADLLEWIEQGILEGGIFSGIVRQIGESVDETTSKWADNIQKAMDWVDKLMEASTVYSHWLTPGGNDMVTQEVDWELFFGNVLDELYRFVEEKVSKIDIPGMLFNVSNFIERVDKAIGGFMSLIAFAINSWVSSGGAERLSEGIVNWIENIGSNPLVNSSIIRGAIKIVAALGRAFSEIDWTGIGAAISQKFLEIIDNTDLLVGNVMQRLATKISEWTESGGGDQLATEFVKWLVQLDTSPEVDSATLDGAKALIKAISKALESVDWDTIGDAIDYKLAKIIEENDWEAAGESFASAIGKIFSRISEGQEGEFDWTRLIPTVYYFKEHWGDSWFVAGREAANEFTTGIINAIFSTDFSNLSEVGQDLWNGLKLGFGDLWVNLKNVMKFGWDDVIRYVKYLLGISSPSTVFFEIGKNIVQGLIDGIKSLIGGVLSALLEPLQPILDFLGIDFGNLSGGFSAPFTGSTAGLTGAGMATPGTATLGTVTNNYNFYGNVYMQGVTNNYNFYGNVYMQGVGPEGTYDCKTPPLITSSQGSLYAPGY